VLLLVTIGLVVVALALLIVGFVQHTLALIYLSIACSALSALTLIVFSRLQRRRSLRLGMAVPVDGGAGPPAADDDSRVSPGAGGRAGRSGRAVAPASGDTGEEAVPAPDLPTGPVAIAPGGRAGPPPPAGGRRPPADADEVPFPGTETVFPIADYDGLRSSDILPLLGQLDPEELVDVRDRELSGQRRRTVLRRIDLLLEAAGWPETTEGDAGEEPLPGGGQAPAEPVGAPAAPPGPSPAAVEAPAAAAPPLPTDAGAVSEYDFPIADYDELTVAEITPLLPQLYYDELVVVAERERAGAGRRTLLARIDRLLAAWEKTGGRGDPEVVAAQAASARRSRSKTEGGDGARSSPAAAGRSAPRERGGGQAGRAPNSAATGAPPAPPAAPAHAAPAHAAPAGDTPAARTDQAGTDYPAPSPPPAAAPGPAVRPERGGSAHQAADAGEGAASNGTAPVGDQGRLTRSVFRRRRR
jgi:hypothetical protein